MPPISTQQVGAPGALGSVLYQTWGSAPAASPYQAVPSAPTSTSGSNSTNNSTSTQNTNYATSPFAALQPAMQTGAQAGLTAGQQALNTGFDPQSALYKQENQKMIDANNVNQAQRGITMSPYGAGVANQAQTNFDSNWLDKQLARQTGGINANNAAINTAQGLYGMGGTTTTNNSGTSSEQGYNTSPVGPIASSGGTRTAGQSGYSNDLLPFPNSGGIVAPYMDVTGLPPTQSAPTGGYSGFQPTMAPQYRDPTGGLQVPQGIDYNTTVNPAQYPMASPYQVMNGLTGSTGQAVSDAGDAAPAYMRSQTNDLGNNFGGMGINQDPSLQIFSQPAPADDSTALSYLTDLYY